MTELEQHIHNVKELLEQGHQSIAIVARSGDGKTFFVEKLKNEVADQYPDLVFYDEFVIPYNPNCIMPLPAVADMNLFTQWLNEGHEFDTYYLLTFSEEYKDSIFPTDVGQQYPDLRLTFDQRHKLCLQNALDQCQAISPTYATLADLTDAIKSKMPV